MSKDGCLGSDLPENKFWCLCRCQVAIKPGPLLFKSVSFDSGRKIVGQGPVQPSVGDPASAGRLD